MEELEVTPPEQYLKGFNNGYSFSKTYPDAGQQVLDIFSSQTNLSSENDFTSVTGMIDGINQHKIEQERELINESLEDIKDLRNQQGEEKSPDLDI